MDRDAFENELLKAKELKKVGKNPAYWTGYMNGLRRRYHGENFGTRQEHRLWLTANGNKANKLRSQGYRDGYGCSQNDGNCATCSRVENMLDCNKLTI